MSVDLEWQEENWKDEPAESRSYETLPDMETRVYRLGEMAARSLVMQRLFARLRQSAPHLRIVTLEGEAGTGKALTARTLHAMGPASAGAFVACAASRFAGEVQPVLEEARGGTLFLTRFHELATEQQGKVFDFLEWWEQKSSREGAGHLPRQLFVSSQQSLRQLSLNGALRADLCYRLTAIRFVLPPLRERREDIPALGDWFAARAGAVHGKIVRGLAPGAVSRLMAHSWPGNVRELESAMASAVMECEGQWIRPIDVPALTMSGTPQAHAVQPAAEAPQADDLNLDHMILRHISFVLTRTGGNKLRAAQQLGISRSTLYRLLESHTLAPQR